MISVRSNLAVAILVVMAASPSLCGIIYLQPKASSYPNLALSANSTPIFSAHHSSTHKPHHGKLITPASGAHACDIALPKGCTCAKSEGALSINCSHVRLTSVPRQWNDVGPTVVKTLNLERNAIRDISDGDFYGIKIERLLLANNSLSGLKFLSFWGLEYSLEILDLSFNQFRRVPSDALRLLRSLKSLSLTGNQIATLNDFDFGYMRKLELLMLDKNPIAEIGKHALVGTQLVLLVLNAIRLPNKLNDMPTEDLKHLKGLSLTHNKIKEIPAQWFRNLRSLRYLNLGHNHIGAMEPDAFVGLEESLRTLELNDNGLVRIPSESVRTLRNLETLDLSHNKIKRIFRRAFNGSSSLHTLNLAHNRVRKLSKRALVGLDNIQRVDLRHNKLITLDDRTFAWASPKGKAVYLEGNPWLCNCILRWVRDEVRRQTELGAIFADDIVCDRPTFLRGVALSAVPAHEITCEHDYYYYYHEYDESNGEASGEGGPPTSGGAGEKGISELGGEDDEEGEEEDEVESEED